MKNVGASGAAESIRSLLTRVQELLDAGGEASEEAAAASGMALTPERQSALGFESWLDAFPSDVSRLGANMAALMLPPTRRLLAALMEALERGASRAKMLGGDQGGGAGDDDSGNPLALCALAAVTLARPQDDFSVEKRLCNTSLGEEGSRYPVVVISFNVLSVEEALAVEGEGEGVAAATALASMDAGDVGEGEDGGGVGREQGPSGDMQSVLAARNTPAPPYPPPLPVSSQWFIRPPVYLFGAGGLSSTPAALGALKLDSPSVTALSLWALREIVHDTLQLFYPLHTDATNYLVHLPIGVGPASQRPFSPVPIIIEALLTEFLWGCGPPRGLSDTYFSAMLLEMFDPRNDEEGAAPPAVGLACRVWFKYLSLIDEASSARLLSWMSHHVSNTKFEWFWKEWEGALSEIRTAGESTPPVQSRALATLLHHTFALIGPFHHHQISSSVFPPLYQATSGALHEKSTTAAASPFFPSLPPAAPPPSVPPSESGAEEPLSVVAEPSISDPVIILAAQITEKLRAKTEDDEMCKWLFQVTTGEGALVESTPHALVPSPTLRLTIFSHALLLYGKANLKNAATLFARYANLLKSTVAVPESVRSHTLLHAMATVWSAAPYLLTSGLVAAAVEAGVVSTVNVVDFLLSPENGGQHPLSTPWKALLLHQCLHEASSRVTRGGVRLSLFVGNDILDPRMQEELEEEVAVAREEALRVAVADRSKEYREAGGAAVSGLIKLTKHATVAATGAGSSDGGLGGGDSLRVSLSHLRRVIKEHWECLVGPGGHLNATLDAFGGDSGLPPSTTSLLLSLSNLFSPHYLVVPSILVRDTIEPPPIFPVADD